MNELQSNFLILSASSSSTSCCLTFSSYFWDNFENRCFFLVHEAQPRLRLYVCVGEFIHE